MKTIRPVLLLITLAFAAGAQGAEPGVTLGPDGGPGSYHLQAAFETAAPCAVAREVITDYEGIGRFVSSIRSSRVLHRGPDGVVIEQSGAGRFLFVTREVTLTLAVRETPDRVEFHQLDARQFRKYEGSWTMSGEGGRCRIAYDLTAAPGASMGPGFAARSVLKHNVEEQLEQVRDEIERRARSRDFSTRN